ITTSAALQSTVRSEIFEMTVTTVLVFAMQWSDSTTHPTALGVRLACGGFAQMMSEVAKRELKPAKELLGRVLGNLAATSGGAWHLLALWTEAVGEAIARCAWPVRLDRGILVIHATSERWAGELTGREADLVQRLSEHLGKGVVHSLRVEVAR